MSELKVGTPRCRGRGHHSAICLPIVIYRVGRTFAGANFPGVYVDRDRHRHFYFAAAAHAGRAQLYGGARGPAPEAFTR